jgi:hypothetical protein
MNMIRHLRSAAAALFVVSPAIALAQTRDMPVEDGPKSEAAGPRPMYNENAYKYDDAKKLCFYTQVNNQIPLRGFVVSANDAVTTYDVSIVNPTNGAETTLYTFNLNKRDMVVWFSSGTYIEKHENTIVLDVFQIGGDELQAVAMGEWNLEKMPDPDLDKIRIPFASMCAQHYRPK